MTYFGNAHAFKCYQGDKSVSLKLDKREALLMAENLLRAANRNKSVDVAIYPARSAKAKTRINVLSSDAESR
ncbi:MAG: hypothetical protein DMG88_01765 [Acidobacteria bacterium]|nr:MAG: hypothetical protein DMG88_01765 [Acidobacteriota bacterium]